VIEDQELDERERLRPVKLRPDGELAQALRAQVRGEVEAVPDGLLQLGGPLPVDVAGDPQVAIGSLLDNGDPPAAVADERGEIRMGETLAEHELSVEVLRVARPARHERHHDVGVALLRSYVRGRVGLAPVELGQYLVGRVAATRAVAVDLPLPPQILGRSEEDPHVVDVSHLRRVVAEQPLDHREGLRDHVYRWSERAIRVAVDGLEDRLPGPQMAEIVAHDVHVVALRSERSDVSLGPLLAVVPVVVVRADVGDLVFAENADEAAGEGRLPRRRVADDAEYGGPGHRSRSFSRPWWRRRCSSAGLRPRS
jgi:hypothetical protein